MSCLQKHYVSRISLLILVFKRQGSKTFNQDDRDDVDHSMSVDRHCHSFVGLIATPQVDTVCIKEFFYLSLLFFQYLSRFLFCISPDLFVFVQIFFIFVLTIFQLSGFVQVCPLTVQCLLTEFATLLCYITPSIVNLSDVLQFVQYIACSCVIVHCVIVSPCPLPSCTSPQKWWTDS